MSISCSPTESRHPHHDNALALDDVFEARRVLPAIGRSCLIRVITVSRSLWIAPNQMIAALGANGHAYVTTLGGALLCVGSTAAIGKLKLLPARLSRKLMHIWQDGPPMRRRLKSFTAVPAPCAAVHLLTSCLLACCLVQHRTAVHAVLAAVFGCTQFAVVGRFRAGVGGSSVWTCWGGADQEPDTGCRVQRESLQLQCELDMCLPAC